MGGGSLSPVFFGGGYRVTCLHTCMFTKTDRNKILGTARRERSNFFSNQLLGKLMDEAEAEGAVETLLCALHF